MNLESSIEQTNGKTVRVWIASICCLVVLILLVGGVTRLTRSGLSMVDWKPIMGVIPPITPADWQITFDKYKQFPEYKLVNHAMTVGEFKSIFMWEYGHRILGRLVGVVFLLPWLYFIVRKRLSGPLIKKTFFGFILGGAQGLMGWYMVKSGLIDVPHVSHYRLVTHLSLAVILFAYFFWIFLSLNPKLKTAETQKTPKWPAVLVWLSPLLTVLVFLQIVYGGLVAGLKAGFTFNTFPKMFEEWIPSSSFSLSPRWINLFDNIALVQFVHRSLAWLIAFSAIGLFVYIQKSIKDKSIRSGSLAVLFITLVQFCLGVATLLLVVPVALASAHQIGAIALLSASLLLNHRVFISAPKAN